MPAACPRLVSATIHTEAAVGDIAAARSLLASDESLAALLYLVVDLASSS